jgi:hypothetical protein
MKTPVKLIEGSFISVWEEGVIQTACRLDLFSGELFPESVDVGDLGDLEREYFKDKDENEYEVCRTCHDFILKTVVGDKADQSYGEYKVCSNPDCESHS